MRRPFKTAIVACGSLLAVSVLWLVASKVFLSRHPCDRLARVLSRSRDGATVVEVFRACTVVGTVVVERVDLVTANDRRFRLLTFVPWGGEVPQGVRVKAPIEPRATWLSAHDVIVSIGTVDRILQERPEAAGVHVKYDVHMVLSGR
jgi:hypothetical protein